MSLWYDHQWWLDRVVTDDTEYAWIGGIGSGGQRLRIVPRLGMMAVTTMGDYNQRAIQRQAEILLDEVMIAVQPTFR